jgi:hypothetical protein
MMFPGEAEVCEVVRHPATAVVLARLIVRCWEPDFGVVTSEDLDKEIPIEGDQIRVGWVTYLSNCVCPPDFEPPASLRVEPVGDIGKLLIVTGEPFSAGVSKQTAALKDLFTLINGESKRGRG